MYLQAPLRVLTEFKLMSLQMFVVVKKKNFGSTTVLATQMAQFKQFCMTLLNGEANRHICLHQKEDEWKQFEDVYKALYMFNRHETD